jgi:hypothetical protein
MLAVAFDTLKLARKLESAGMQPKQAQDTSAALSESFSEWLSLGNIATREDVQRLESAMREDVQRLEGKTDKVDAKIDNLEARIGAKFAETKVDILKWIIGAMGAQTVALLAALYGLAHSIGKL